MHSIEVSDPLSGAEELSWFDLCVLHVCECVEYMCVLFTHMCVCLVVCKCLCEYVNTIVSREAHICYVCVHVCVCV